MSLFLGKIHYWLYNKIQWFEKIEKDLVRLGREAGLPVDDWYQELQETYGSPVGGKPLEEVIDTSNIHGWLQERITRAELRQAVLITKLLSDKPALKDELLKAYEAQGRAAAMSHPGKADSPVEVYNILNDYILEGMPCDRVDEMITDNEKEYAWRTTVCLHQPHWEKAGGRVEYFYDFREAWMRSFVAALDPSYIYKKPSMDSHQISRV